MLFSAGEPHSYPFKLRDLLAMRYPLQTIDIINTGWSGEYASRSGNGSPGGQRRLLTELQLRNPEVLLLMEGSNDLLESDGFETGLAALDRMVQDAKNHGVRVFLATIPPQRAGGIRDRVAQMIPSFNEQVRAIATRQNVVLVDVFAKLEPNIQLFIGVDDLHPTEMGFGAIAEAFFEAIRGNLEPTEISSAHVW
jgi:lysophospholipase L1-like esterase